MKVGRERRKDERRLTETRFFGGTTVFQGLPPLGWSEWGVSVRPHLYPASFQGREQRCRGGNGGRPPLTMKKRPRGQGAAAPCGGSGAAPPRPKHPADPHSSEDFRCRSAVRKPGLSVHRIPPRDPHSRSARRASSAGGRERCERNAASVRQFEPAVPGR